MTSKLRTTTNKKFLILQKFVQTIIMSFTHNYYWPYVEGEPIVHYDFVACLDRPITLLDGGTFYFGDVETHTDVINDVVSMIFYVCANTSHSHPDLPSCTRLVMCYLIGT